LARLPFVLSGFTPRAPFHGLAAPPPLPFHRIEPQLCGIAGIVRLNPMHVAVRELPLRIAILLNSWLTRVVTAP
jgi:hypothetical protein